MHGTRRAPQTRNAGPQEQAGRLDRCEPRRAGLQGLRGAARAEEGCPEGHRQRLAHSRSTGNSRLTVSVQKCFQD